MATDLVRLHNVASGKLQGRGVGKTYLKCHDVAGTICLGEDYIIVLVSYLRDINYIYPMLREVLHEYSLEVDKVVMTNHKILLTNGTVIKFFSESIELCYQLAGYSGKPIVYMRHRD